MIKDKEPSPSLQLEIIKRGAAQIISEPELVKKLEASLGQKRPLRIKAGFDPTAPDLHLGHTVLLRKLRQFQDLGHQVIFLIGDFTGRIGDPSGRDEKRKQLSDEEVNQNAATYKKQVFKILHPEKTEVVFNSEWFDKMRGLEFGRLLTHYTATRLMERDDFSKRIKEHKPLYMHELIYPILQGYDSVVLKADVEIGGEDQIFNLLVGRDLQRDFGQPEQIVLTMPLLEGTDGKAKMSKSHGNYIGIDEKPEEIFGKVMSISDELMLKYYELLTDIQLSGVCKKHPKEAKEELAWLIVKDYHGQGQAEAARRNFNKVFKDGEIPGDINEYTIGKDEKILDLLTASGLVQSRNEARRLIQQGGVIFSEQKISAEDFLVTRSGILRVGSRRFLKIIKK